MAFASLEAYVHGNSVVHRWPPRLKLVGLGVLMFAFATVQQGILLLPIAAIAAVLYGLSRLPLGFLSHRLRYPGLFIAAVVVLLPFTAGDTVIAQWGWLALRQEGLEAASLIVVRFVSILTLGFILLGTTPFLTIIQAMRGLGLPVILADMTLLAYRYLYEIADNLATMQKSMALRGFGHQPRRWGVSRRTVQQLAMLVGSLLLRSYEQSERVYKAMRLRGYGYGQGNQATLGRTNVDAQSLVGWGLTVAVLAMAVCIVAVEVALSIG
ncbi:MAG: cobalt ECF transporter T component CbiQ [Leptolyngbya sp. LCM1.Bin17]|nr:MAG: cobalt ECF transporter T component CbiQ [Leptolyngbya sp. LCM1.Bin17]